MPCHQCRWRLYSHWDAVSQQLTQAAGIELHWCIHSFVFHCHQVLAVAIGYLNKGQASKQCRGRFSVKGHVDVRNATASFLTITTRVPREDYSRRVSLVTTCRAAFVGLDAGQKMVEAISDGIMEYLHWQYLRGKEIKRQIRLKLNSVSYISFVEMRSVYTHNLWMKLNKTPNQAVLHWVSECFVITFGTLYGSDQWSLV